LKVLILAGGKGTRFREETDIKPKPMIEINGIPMLIHIINHYKYYGFYDFTVLCGFKINYINSYFNNRYSKIDENIYKFQNSKVRILDTGLDTMTGGRIKQAIEIVGGNDFMLTYGDGISNVNLKKLYKFYKENNFLGVVTAVRPPARFGRLKLESSTVVKFGEKNQTDEGWINGGFFVLNKAVKNYIDGDNTVFEESPLEKLSKEHKLGAFLHTGFWQCCDTIREKEIREEKIKLEGLDYES
jgi:glucose-1-phosphate cytidylyltransferase